MRILQVLAQRPTLTGSGVTFDAIARELGVLHELSALVAVPADVPVEIEGTPPVRVERVRFRSTGGASSSPADLDHDPVGMSDVMPYPSVRWRDLRGARLDAYRDAFRAALVRAIESFSPDLIHVHHAWLAAAIAASLPGRPPLLIHAHGTCLRQLELAPHLAEEVTAGCEKADGWLFLHDDHARGYSLRHRVRRSIVVGAGYDERTFRPTATQPEARRSERDARVAFVGKLSLAKGVAALLDAWPRVLERVPEASLDLVGGTAGEEGLAIVEQARRLGSSVTVHGRLDAPEVAKIFRRSRACVLPSYFEGLPLVLVEAAACGCRLVSSALPGVLESLAPAFGDLLRTVPLPRLEGPDVPAPEDLPAFTSRLARAIADALEAPSLSHAYVERALEPFRWSAVAGRIDGAWRTLSSASSSPS